MDIKSKVVQFLTWVKSTTHEYGRVQGEATMETLRRFRGLAPFLFVLHMGLALWFAMYEAPKHRPEMQVWSHDLMLIQALAAVVILLFGIYAHTLLQRSNRASYVAIVAQIAISASYVLLGLLLTSVDLRAGAGAGTASFMLISVLVGVVSLMRPEILVPLYASSYIVFLAMMSRSPYC